MSTTETAVSLPGFEPEHRPLGELITEAHDFIRSAKAEHRPTRTFLLLSGGNDSLVLLDSCAELADEVVHINTGIGIPETNEFARKVGSSYGLPFTELTPPVPYEELVLDADRWNGLPGPGAHRFTYSMLKERCVEELLRGWRKTPRSRERWLLLAGVRKAESKRRMGHSEPIRRNGSQVWANPLHTWSHASMGEYRRSRNLPVNEVAANLHMSGECLCGAMADQGPEREERAAIRFFYPDFDARLTDIEARCRAAGLRYCEWGVKRPPEVKVSPGQVEMEFSPMCSSCEGRQTA